MTEQLLIQETQGTLIVFSRELSSLQLKIQRNKQNRENLKIKKILKFEKEGERKKKNEEGRRVRVKLVRVLDQEQGKREIQKFIKK